MMVILLQQFEWVIRKQEDIARHVHDERLAKMPAYSVGGKPKVRVDALAGTH